MIERPVFRASLPPSTLEIELYQIFLPYDRGRSGYEIRATGIGTLFPRERIRRGSFWGKPQNSPTYLFNYHRRYHSCVNTIRSFVRRPPMTNTIL